MDENELAFRLTFRQTLSSAKHLVMKSVANTNAGLRKLMAFALHSHTPSGYPFVLKYSFCRRERPSTFSSNHRLSPMTSSTVASCDTEIVPFTSSMT